MAREARRGSVFLATLFAGIVLAVLVGLGTWQLQRKAWKENLIAALTDRLARPPVPLPLRDAWPQLKQEGDEFRRVAFSAEFIPGEEALVYSAGSSLRRDVKGPGYWVFSPARLPGGSIIVLNRGYVPLDRKDAASRGEGVLSGSVEITGFMRWPEAKVPFTPTDDESKVWFLRDHTAMAYAKRWDTTAPFYIDQETPVPPGGLPSPGTLTVSLPNNHLQYAVTWFGLALTLVGVYGFWLRGRLRQRA